MNIFIFAKSGRGHGMGKVDWFGIACRVNGRSAASKWTRTLIRLPVFREMNKFYQLGPYLINNYFTFCQKVLHVAVRLTAHVSYMQIDEPPHFVWILMLVPFVCGQHFLWIIYEFPCHIEFMWKLFALAFSSSVFDVCVCPSLQSGNPFSSAFLTNLNGKNWHLSSNIYLHSAPSTLHPFHWNKTFYFARSRMLWHIYCCPLCLALMHTTCADKWLNVKTFFHPIQVSGYAFSTWFPHIELSQDFCIFHYWL